MKFSALQLFVYNVTKIITFALYLMGFRNFSVYVCYNKYDVTN